MADKDLSIWETEDDVRRSGLDRLPVTYLVTEEDVGLIGGVAEAYRRAQFEKDSVAAEARNGLDALLHLLLNLMRADSGLDFIEETNPDKWPANDLSATVVHTKKKRKRVAGTGTGQASGDGFMMVDVIDREEGWGNEFVAARNPSNSDGVNNASEPRPGWWYRMVHDERNRETVLRSLKFWEPEKVGRMVEGQLAFNPVRHAQLMKDPRRARALDYVKRSRELFAGGSDNLPPALDETVVEAIQRDLANKMGTQKDIAERHGVSIATVSRINSGKYRAGVGAK